MRPPVEVVFWNPILKGCEHPAPAIASGVLRNQIPPRRLVATSAKSGEADEDTEDRKSHPCGGYCRFRFCCDGPAAGEPGRNYRYQPAERHALDPAIAKRDR